MPWWRNDSGSIVKTEKPGQPILHCPADHEAGCVIVDDACVRNPSQNPLISLGYEGRDAADLIEQLRASGVCQVKRDTSVQYSSFGVELRAG